MARLSCCDNNLIYNKKETNWTYSKDARVRSQTDQNMSQHLGQQQQSQDTNKSQEHFHRIT